MNMYVLCMYSVCVEIIEVPSETFDSPNNQKLVRGKAQVFRIYRGGKQESKKARRGRGELLLAPSLCVRSRNDRSAK
jgi:hypothetical protein